MQRILSVQTSRSAHQDNIVGSEFVTKRLCCSFLFVVAFFSILGGFMLGRYAADRTIASKNANIKIIQEKVVSLYWRFSQTFQKSDCRCNQTEVQLRCNLTVDREIIENYQSAEILNILNECFGT